MRCHFCNKEIKYLYPDEDVYNLDNASEIITWEEIPIVRSSYGSKHDCDVSFFTDRNLAKELKNTKAYICDDCLNKLLDEKKLVLFEGMDAPWMYSKVNPEHFYQSIPRQIIAWSFEDLFNMTKAEQEKYRIKINNRFHPMKVTKDDQVVTVLYDDILILTEIGKLDVMKKYQFEKLFIPKV